MITKDIDETIREFSRKQKVFRIIFISTLIGALLTTLAVVVRLSRRANHAEETARTQSERADVATKDLAAVADRILQRVQELDQQTLDLTRPTNPIVYLWRDGLNPRKPEQGLSMQAELKLIPLLHERRFLLGDSGPSLEASRNLKNYVCGHIWFVIAASVPAVRAEKYVSDSASKDPRFQLVETAGEPENPSRAILVGFFLTHQVAEELAEELHVRSAAVQPLIKRWGEFQQKCTAP